MADAKFLRGIKFWTRIFFNISTSFNKVEDMPKITATVKNTILFNELIINLLCDCHNKKSEKCLSKRLINSANPSSNIGKILTDKNMKLVIENV